MSAPSTPRSFPLALPASPHVRRCAGVAADQPAPTARHTLSLPFVALAVVLAISIPVSIQSVRGRAQPVRSLRYTCAAQWANRNIDPSSLMVIAPWPVACPLPISDTMFLSETHLTCACRCEFFSSICAYIWPDNRFN